MQTLGYPVVMDITHSLQQPNQGSGVTGGQPAMIETIGRAWIAAGADGIFIESAARSVGRQKRRERICSRSNGSRDFSNGCAASGRRSTSYSARKASASKPAVPRETPAFAFSYGRSGGPADDTKHSGTFAFARRRRMAEAYSGQLLIKSQQIGPNEPCRFAIRSVILRQ